MKKGGLRSSFSMPILPQGRKGRQGDCKRQEKDDERELGHVGCRQS